MSQVWSRGSKALLEFLKDGPQANSGVSLQQQSVILTGRALQCQAELVMLHHFSKLFTAREPHKLLQKAFNLGAMPWGAESWVLWYI